jgi:hypothetical protein
MWEDEVTVPVLELRIRDLYRMRQRDPGLEYDKTWRDLYLETCVEACRVRYREALDRLAEQ